MQRVLFLVRTSFLAVTLAALFTFAALGSFYAQVTTDPLEPAMTLEAGLGMWGTFTSAPDIGLGLDLYTRVENILSADNDWKCGFLVGVTGTEITLDFGMDFGFNQEYWSDELSLTQWDTTATIAGHPGDITLVWGTVALKWEESNVLVPEFELGVRVDIP